MRKATPGPWNAVGRALLSALALFGSLALGQGGPAAPVAAGTQADNVAVITIRGPIDEYTMRSVKRRMELAEKGGAEAVVFEIDTPGGDLVAVLDICDLIKRSPIANTVAWVNTKAYSGGAVIALACREIITSDPATLGDALPISTNPYYMLNGLPEAERQKALIPLVSEVVDSARRRGYDEKLVQGIVSRGVELWLIQDKSDPSRRLFIGPEEFRTVFGTEPDRTMIPTVVAAAPLPGESDATEGATGQAAAGAGDPTAVDPASPAIAQIAGDVNLTLERATNRPVLTAADRGRWALVEYVSDGQSLIVLKTQTMKRYGLSRAVVGDDEELRAYFGAKNVRRLEPTWSEGLTVFLTNWIVRAVLIVVFLVGLFLEMTHPGLVVPGGVAACALLGLLAPPLVVGMANWWEIAAVLVGVLLIAMEIFVLPGFGVAGVLGLLLLFGGLIGTFVHESPGSLFPNSSRAQNDLVYGVVSIALALGTSSIAIYYLGKHFGSLPVLGRLVLKQPAADEIGQDEFLAAMADAGGPVSVGMIGTAVTPLRPAGRVQVGDRVIDVVSELAFVRPGERVRIVSVGEFRIVVEPAGAEGGDSGEGAA